MTRRLTTRRLSLALAAAAVLGAAPAALAQPASGGADRGAAMQERMMTALFEGITLTAEQQARVEAVTKKYQPRVDSARTEMMAARQGGGRVSPESMRAMRAVQTEQRAALRAELTPEQQARFDRNVAAMTEGRGVRRGGRPPRGGGLLRGRAPRA